MNRRTQLALWYLVLIFLVILAVGQFSVKKPVEVFYSEFKRILADGGVAEVVLGKDVLRGRLVLPEAEKIRGLKGTVVAEDFGRPVEPEDGADSTGAGSTGKVEVDFLTRAMPAELADESLLEDLQKYGVDYRREPTNEFGTFLLTWVLPIILIVMIGLFLMRQVGRTGSMVMSFGKSRAKVLAEKETNTTFDDVAGCDEAKEELHEIIEFLRNPRKFQTLGGKIPKGVLLVGPPGTGKTLLARAIAGEAEATFFSISGSDFVEMFVGVGAARVRDLFQQAKQKTPCIIFIDEIDAVGRQRGAGIGGGHDEREQTLNQLLVEMDGFDTQKGVIIIAATNRPDVLDPALLRPGRFDRQIVIDTADVKGREAILKVHCRDKPLAEDVDLSTIAKRTPGFTGADLANAVNEAALIAARRDRREVTMIDFEEAIDRVIAGPERRSRIISEKEKIVIAYHEAGHALLGLLVPKSDRVHKVSIIPRGHAALGYTLQLPSEDRYILTKEELLARVIGTLGGRIAEEIVFDHLSTGAHNDFEKVTDLVRRMVCQYGMSEKLGPLVYGRGGSQVFLGRDFHDEQNYSEKTAVEIDDEVRGIVKDCYDEARRLLTENRDKLDRLATELMKQEVMDADEIRSVVFGGGPSDGDASGGDDGPIPAAGGAPGASNGRPDSDRGPVAGAGGPGPDASAGSDSGRGTPTSPSGEA